MCFFQGLKNLEAKPTEDLMSYSHWKAIHSTNPHYGQLMNQYKTEAQRDLNKMKALEEKDSD